MEEEQTSDVESGILYKKQVKYVGSIAIPQRGCDDRQQFINEKFDELKDVVKGINVVLIVTEEGVKILKENETEVKMAHGVSRIILSTCQPARNLFAYVAKTVTSDRTKIVQAHMFKTKRSSHTKELNVSLCKAFKKVAEKTSINRKVKSTFDVEAEANQKSHIKGKRWAKQEIARGHEHSSHAQKANKKTSEAIDEIKQEVERKHSQPQVDESRDPGERKSSRAQDENQDAGERKKSRAQQESPDPRERAQYENQDAIERKCSKAEDEHREIKLLKSSQTQQITRETGEQENSEERRESLAEKQLESNKCSAVTSPLKESRNDEAKGINIDATIYEKHAIDDRKDTDDGVLLYAELENDDHTIAGEIYASIDTDESISGAERHSDQNKPKGDLYISLDNDISSSDTSRTEQSSHTISKESESNRSLPKDMHQGRTSPDINRPENSKNVFSNSILGTTLPGMTQPGSSSPGTFSLSRNSVLGAALPGIPQPGSSSPGKNRSQHSKPVSKKSITSAPLSNSMDNSVLEVGKVPYTIESGGEKRWERDISSLNIASPTQKFSAAKDSPPPSPTEGFAKVVRKREGPLPPVPQQLPPPLQQSLSQQPLQQRPLPQSPQTLPPSLQHRPQPVPPPLREPPLPPALQQLSIQQRPQPLPPPLQESPPHQPQPQRPLPQSPQSSQALPPSLQQPPLQQRPQPLPPTLREPPLPPALQQLSIQQRPQPLPPPLQESLPHQPQPQRPLPQSPLELPPPLRQLSLQERPQPLPPPLHEPALPTPLQETPLQETPPPLPPARHEKTSATGHFNVTDKINESLPHVQPSRPKARKKDSTASFAMTEDDILKNTEWYQAGYSREIAESILANRSVGSFFVRQSHTKVGSYVMTLKVPTNVKETGFGNFLIEMSGGKFRIRGFKPKFDSLTDVVAHYSSCREDLPVQLYLGSDNKHTNEMDEEEDYSDLDYAIYTSADDMMKELSNM